MSTLRWIVVAALVALLMAAPSFITQALGSPAQSPSVYAAPPAAPLAGGDNDDNNNNGDNDEDNDDGDNDEDNGDDNDEDNEDGGPPPPAAAPPGPPTEVSGCVSSGGSVTLQLPGGSAAVTNVIARGINVRLERAAASVPGLVDAIVFNVIPENCGGGALADPAPDINLGIRYSVGANKAGLRIARLEGNQFTEANVRTVPDPNPNNPYVSATIPGRP